MIVGVDHIALSCARLDDGIGHMSRLGFELTFLERDAPNHPVKRAYLGTFRATHSLAMCRSAAGVSIELTEHGPPAGVASYNVIFEGLFGSDFASAPEDAVAVAAALGVGNPVLTELPGFAAKVWADPAPHRPASIKAVMLAVSDFEVSKRFWCDGIGFRLISEGHADHPWAVLEIWSPFPRCRLTLLLTERRRASDDKLDACGFPCLALLVTQLPSDRAKLLEHGGRDQSDGFELTVNGKPLVIALVRGPDREIVELIQPLQGRPA